MRSIKHSSTTLETANAIFDLNIVSCFNSFETFSNKPSLFEMMLRATLWEKALIIEVLKSSVLITELKQSEINCFKNDVKFN